MRAWKYSGRRTSTRVAIDESLHRICTRMRSGSMASMRTASITVRSNCFRSWVSVVDASQIARASRQSRRSSSHMGRVNASGSLDTGAFVLSDLSSVVRISSSVSDIAFTFRLVIGQILLTLWTTARLESDERVLVPI